MPIIVGADIRPMSLEEFKAAAYEVMGVVFEIHHDFGRLFDEWIYQRELAYRLPDARREVPIEVTFDGFRKEYHMDILLRGGAVFELKTVEKLTPRHEGQLLNYLLLTELPRGKLINLRPDRVEHRFVNATLSRADRMVFDVYDDDWQEIGDVGLRPKVLALLHDWGTGLTAGLYEEALGHACGAETPTDIEVRAGPRCLGMHSLRLACPDVAFRVTGLPLNRLPDFKCHLHRLLSHTALRAIQWVNITHRDVHFTTIS
jgi:GxxExxY protein